MGMTEKDFKKIWEWYLYKKRSYIKIKSWLFKDM